MVVEDLISGPWVCGRVSGPVLVTFSLMRRGSAAAGGSLVNIGTPGGIGGPRMREPKIWAGLMTTLCHISAKRGYNSTGHMPSSNVILPGIFTFAGGDGFPFTLLQTTNEGLPDFASGFPLRLWLKKHAR